MTELRWALVALGVLLISGIVLWDRGPFRKLKDMTAKLREQAASARERIEPEFADDDPDDDIPELDDVTEAAAPSAAPESVVTIRFIPHGGRIAADRVVLALRAAGLRHGRYDIFHMYADDVSREPLFSVASLTEPGSFDLTRLAETKIPGMSFFMLLPGTGHPVERFDRMVATAKELARKLDAELRDEKGSSWSIQRERYVREEIIQYFHLHDRPRPG